MARRPYDLGPWAQTDLPPLVRRIYAARVAQPRDTLLTWDALPDFAALQDMARGAARLARAVVDQEAIVIAGDYDADGATATAVVYRALKQWGGRVDYVVPLRREEGYGLTTPLAARILKDHPCQLVVTVDNGIASHEGVAHLSAASVDTVITDHHLPADGPLPAAYAVINPRRRDETVSAPHLAGVGVAFGLMVRVRAILLNQGYDQRIPAVKRSLTQLLDLVAIGTVADVVALDRANRLLVEQGLRYLRAGGGCVGVRALATRANRPLETIQAEDLAYALGPRLNAAGRLTDMRLGIRLLTTDDPDEAETIAGALQDINEARRSRETDMRQEAWARIAEEITATQAEIPAGLVLGQEGWHEGIVGLVAGRVKDRLYRPVIACAPSLDGAEWKGSARSIPGVHIRDVLARIDQQSPGLITRFGGHAAAAGFTIPRARLAELQTLFPRAVLECAVSPEVFAQTILTDGPLAPEEITLENAQALQSAGPWGAGFPPPLFEGDFEVLTVQPLKEGLHARLTVRAPGGKGPIWAAIAFHTAEHLSWTPERGIHRFLYALTVNTFRQQQTVQLRIEGVPSATAPTPDAGPESQTHPAF